MKLGAPLRTGRGKAAGLHVPLVRVISPGADAPAMRVHLLLYDSSEGGKPLSVMEPLEGPPDADVVVGVAITGAGKVALEGSSNVVEVPDAGGWRRRLAVGPTVVNEGETHAGITVHVTQTTVTDGAIGEIVSVLRASKVLQPGDAFEPGVVVELPGEETA